MYRIGILLRDHVHMPLQDHTFTSLHPGSGRLPYDDIPCFIPYSLKSQRLAESIQELRHFAFFL